MFDMNYRIVTERDGAVIIDTKGKNNIVDTKEETNKFTKGEKNKSKW